MVAAKRKTGKRKTKMAGHTHYIKTNPPPGSLLAAVVRHIEDVQAEPWCPAEASRDIRVMHFNSYVTDGNLSDMPLELVREFLVIEPLIPFGLPVEDRPAWAECLINDATELRRSQLVDRKPQVPRNKQKTWPQNVLAAAVYAAVNATAGQKVSWNCHFERTAERLGPMVSRDQVRYAWIPWWRALSSSDDHIVAGAHLGLK